jgi:Ras-related protein Rab-5C
MRGSRPGTLLCRVVTLGLYSVGKTSIVSQLIENNFRFDEPPTVGANFREFSHKTGDTRIELQIWDTSGTEKYRSLTPIYFRNAGAAIAVFAMNNPDSFDSLEEQLTVFHSVAEDAIVYIAANKIDTEPPQIDREKVIEFAESQHCRLFFTSAKTGEGIKDMFTELCDALYQKKGNQRQNRTWEIGNEENRGCC